MTADVILPLPLEGTFTYKVPESMKDSIGVGFRVVVQFGAKKYYTAIIASINEDNAEKDENDKGKEKKLKSLIEVLDNMPIVTPLQLELWQWIANYYLCSIGDVYKAALPAGLKIESETTITINEDYEENDSLTDKEKSLILIIENEKELNISKLEKLSGQKNVLSAVMSLMKKGIISVKESLVRNYKPKTEKRIRLNEGIEESKLPTILNILGKAPKQQQLLLTFLSMSEEEEFVRKSELLKKASSTSAICRQLIEKNILEEYDESINRMDCADEEEQQESYSVLDTQQQKAYDEITGLFREGKTVLLHGVTSSGKTEVYIHLAKKCISEGKQVLYLLPEIALTTQITDRLRKVFGNSMGVYHSKFADAQRVDVYRKQLSESPYSIILGVRSAIFLPFSNLGLIIVDEEHETSYKQQDPAPRYHARNSAIMLAIMAGNSRKSKENGESTDEKNIFGNETRILLGSATPSLESFHNAQTGKYGYVSMEKRFAGITLPEIQVVDIKRLRHQKRMKGSFSPQLIEAMDQTLKDGKQIILFHNRRGYSPFVQCRTCGWVPRCQQCDVSLTYHKETRLMTCHYCGFTYHIPSECPSCGDTNIISIGIGTEHVEDEVKRIFPQAKISRMDLDTARSRAQYERIINSFGNHETDILIGTQMVSKGLDFADVSLVGILDADTLLNYPDFRSYERAFDMLSQVSGRSGRSGKQGLVVLQTRSIDNEIITSVVNHDFRMMYDSQMDERLNFRYPPLYRLIYVYVRHRDFSKAEEAAQYIAQRLTDTFTAERVLGPDKPVVARIQALHIRKIMIKMELSLPIATAKKYLKDIHEDTVSKFSGALIHFDVDPL